MGKNKNKKRSKKGGNNNKKRTTTTTTEPTAVVVEDTPILNAETQQDAAAAKRPSDSTALPEALQKGWDQLTAKQQVLSKLLCSLGQEHLFQQETAVACAVQIESLNETCPLPAFLMENKKAASPQETAASKTAVKSLALKDLSSVAFVYVDESGKTSDLEKSLKSVLRLQLEAAAETKLPVVVLTTSQTVIDVTKKTLKDSQVSIVAPVLCPILDASSKMVLNDKGLIATQVSTDAWLAATTANYAAFLKDDDVVVSEDGISITAVEVKGRVPCILLVEKKALVVVEKKAAVVVEKKATTPVVVEKKAVVPVVELLPDAAPKMVVAAPSSPPTAAAAAAVADDSSPRSVVGTPKAASATSKGVVDLMAPNPEEVTNKADDECSCVIL